MFSFSGQHPEASTTSFLNLHPLIGFLDYKVSAVQLGMAVKLKIKFHTFRIYGTTLFTISYFQNYGSIIVYKHVEHAKDNALTFVQLDANNFEYSFICQGVIIFTNGMRYLHIIKPYMDKCQQLHGVGSNGYTRRFFRMVQRSLHGTKPNAKHKKPNK